MENCLQLHNIESLCNELKCSQCEQLLNVFPIYYGSKIGNVCGRCTKALEPIIASGLVQRAVAYESVAKYLEFPCRYSVFGCKESLKWDKIIEHEDNCMFMGPAVCLFEPCKWRGIMDNFTSHLYECHNDCYQAIPISASITTTADYRKMFFTTLSEQTFIVLVTLSNYTLNCAVKCVYIHNELEHHFYRFQFELGKNNNDSTLIVRKEYTEKFSSHFAKDSGIDVDINSAIGILGFLHDNIIHCKVSIFKKSKKDVAAVAREFNLVVPATKTVGKQLETHDTLETTIKSTSVQDLTYKSTSGKPETEKCFVCKLSTTKLISTCPMGHWKWNSICDDCETTINVCPACYSTLPGMDNYWLNDEKCATSRSISPVQHPSFKVPKPENMEPKVLYQNCPFRLIPGMCHDKNFLYNSINAIYHFRQNHLINLFEHDHVFIKPMAFKQTYYYATIYNDEIFIFCMHVGGIASPIKFACFRVGIQNVSTEYVFELEFIDQSNKDRKLIINQVCHQPNSIHLISASKSYTLVIPGELLKPFIANQPKSTLYLKCSIKAT